MENKSKLFLAFGAGALLGAAAVALLNSEKGKVLMNEFSEEVKKKFSDLSKEFSGDAGSSETKENPTA